MPALAGVLVFVLAFGLYFSVHLVSRRSDASLRELSLAIELGVERLLLARLHAHGDPVADPLDPGDLERMAATVERFAPIARLLRLSDEALSLERTWADWLAARSAGTGGAEDDVALLSAFESAREEVRSYASGIGSSFDLTMILFGLTLSLGSAGAVGYWSVAKSHELRRDLAERAFRMALAAEERVRAGIAMELHDDIAQDLVAARMQCERAAAGSGGRDSLPGLAAATISAASAKIRLICTELRPTELHDLGLSGAIASLCEEIARRSDRPVARELPDELPRLEPEAELALWRIVREALSNAAKHSRGGIRVAARVTESPRGPRMEVEVADGGHASRPEPRADGASSGYGLGVMRERARAAGLELDVDIDPAGSRILIKASLDARSADREESGA